MQGVQFIVLYNVQGVQFIVLYKLHGIKFMALNNVQGVQFMALYKGSTFNRFVLCTGCTAGVQLKILC